MSLGLPSGLLHEGMLMLATAGGPVLVALLVIGLVTGILQAATQINDPAVGFIPRLLAGLIVCFVMGHWMMEKLAGFLGSSIERMGNHQL